ncbi:flagellin [Falsiroseomonas sp. CW058]|uniref:flagellin N-terminal helical domain-containing protein n=1 Tax=Falsiroseomonas sp. CW058 TaxID=3388664 RepID=UPI003D31AA3B
MSSINTNVAAMAAVRSLNTISTDMGRTQQRIETGLRIGKANDDPAVFTIGQSMRADLNGLNAVVDSQNFGRAALSVARDAATRISNELGKLKQTITQGQQQGLNQATMNAQITSALSNIDAFAGSASFNGVNLINGGGGSLQVLRDISGSNTQIAASDLRSSAGGLNLAGLTVTQGARQIAFDSSLAISDGMGLSVTVGTTTFVFEFNSDATLAGSAGPNTVVRSVEFTATQSPLQRLGTLLQTMAQDGINASFDNNGNIIISNATDVASGGNGSTAVTGATVTQIGGAQGAIARVDGAITTSGNVLARLGAALQQVEGLRDFSVQLRDSLREGLGALVDADLAEESARLSSLQTRQQLATQSLSIANQQSQGLLSLFR